MPASRLRFVYRRALLLSKFGIKLSPPSIPLDPFHMFCSFLYSH